MLNCPPCISTLRADWNKDPIVASGKGLSEARSSEALLKIEVVKHTRPDPRQGWASLGSIIFSSLGKRSPRMLMVVNCDLCRGH